MAEMTPEKLRGYANYQQAIHFTIALSAANAWEACLRDASHALAIERQDLRARLGAAKKEILNWRATHYEDMLYLGQLDIAEFDKRIAGLNVERAALAAKEETNG